MSDDKVVPPEEELNGPEVDTEEATVDEKERLAEELKEMTDKYLRLYADFENYRKRVNKDKEELVKYGQIRRNKDVDLVTRMGQAHRDVVLGDQQPE